MGTTLPSRFEPIRLLRKDRVSSTFVATDRGLGRNEVVVKVFGRGAYAPDTETLVDIFSWYRGLRHPLISEILDAGLTSRRELFCVRAYHPPSEFFTSTNATSLKALISAIDFLHSMGRVHGSIKPSNVFAAQDSVKISDPWIGQNRLDPKWPLTEEDIRFSAPEVLSGGAVSTESDLYSLGAVLYRFFSGRDPFEDSDLESLKAKYIWAAPRSLASVSHVSKTIGEVVADLLNKDPGLRKAAFETLKDELDIVRAVASRAPALGFHSLVSKTLSQIMTKPGLSMGLVEGPIGIGKSRFIEELQNRASLEGIRSIVCPSTQGAYTRLVRDALFAADQEGVGTGSSSLARLHNFVATEDEPLSLSEHQDLDRDLVGLLASIARQKRLILVMEDIDRNGQTFAGLADALVHQLCDLELSLVVTARSVSSGRSDALRKAKDFLGHAFYVINLEFLSPENSRFLVSLLSNYSDQRANAEHKAGGNPMFIEEYARNPIDTVPKRMRNSLSSLASGLPESARRVAEILSILGVSADWDLLAKVSGISEVILRKSVSHLEQLGLVKPEKPLIRYRDFQAILHSKMPKTRRTDLHARSFRYLSELRTETKILADHAFRGSLFVDAGSLYRLLGANAFSVKDYRSAARYFSLVSECRERDPRVPSLDPSDRIKLAKSQAAQGNKSLGRSILRQLLESKLVCDDSELLSAVYAALASPAMEDSVDERIRLLRLSISCLQVDSLQRPERYLALAATFLWAGNPTEANAILKKKAVECKSEDTALSLDVLGSILMSQGNFKEGAQYLSERQRLWSTTGVAANNLAVCLEQLGDLIHARQIQHTALKEGEATGALWVQIMSLGNLGSMETKLGNLATAERLFALAIKKLGEFERVEGGGILGTFAITYADAASHFAQRGEYRRAIDYIGRINLVGSSSPPLERFMTDVTRSELHIALGQLDRVRQLLTEPSLSTLDGEFFRVERLLIETALVEPSQELCTRLESALLICANLGTRYQECRARLALAKLLISLGDLRKGRAVAKSAFRIARRNSYRLLAVRALLLVGKSAKHEIEREFVLRRSLDEAAEIGLLPLVVECAFEIGVWRFDLGDYASAREHLSRSISVATHLGEELSSADRRSYFAQSYTIRTRALLDEATSRARSLPSKKLPKFLDKESIYFARLYRLSAALSASVDLVLAITTLLETLKQAMSHPSLVVSGIGTKLELHSVRPNLSAEMERRATEVAANACEKPYLTGIGTTGITDTAAWIPILSLAFRGGIYVECVPGQPPLEEREIEFLIIAAAIAGAAFDRVSCKVVSPELSASSRFHGLVGNSKQILEVREGIQIAAKNAASVLIEGDSGTGKELVARAIHANSVRSKAPFIPVDCGALPDGLIEAELFGAKKGAYTGANADRQGLFEAAHNGTIFLDEISNLGIAAQAKLLRVVQDREVRRIGSMTGRVVDVRLIAATNCNLERLVREGKFRQDLLYRLKVLHIFLPALRSRKTDIPVLATTFLERLNVLNHTHKYFGARVLDEFMEHDYPGNVRELQNAVERAFYSSNNVVISRVDFLREANSSDQPAESETESWFRNLTEGRENFWSAVHDRYKRRDISRESVLALMDFGLRATHGNYKAMASMLQIPKEEYRRFMDFLRRSRCLLDFRPYRKSSGTKPHP